MATKKTFPDLYEETKLWNNGIQYVAGVDEVGRGAFAGPVVAAAVILAPTPFPNREKIRDSKMLSAKQRSELEIVIKKYAIAYSISEIPVDTINRVGIGKATQEAFTLAIAKLSIQPLHILIDAFSITSIPKEKQTPIIKGDSKCCSIAAASIIAKVYRDALMQKLDTLFKKYNFAQHKGYGTLSHRNAIKQFGLCPLHRTSFNLTKFL